MNERAKLNKRIIELTEQKMTQSQIAKTLNDEGFKTPNGSAFEQWSVSHYGRKLGLQRQKRRKTRTKKLASVAKPTPDKITKNVGFMDVVTKTVGADWLTETEKAAVILRAANQMVQHAG